MSLIVMVIMLMGAMVGGELIVDTSDYFLSLSRMAVPPSVNSSKNLPTSVLSLAVVRTLPLLDSVNPQAGEWLKLVSELVSYS